MRIGDAVAAEEVFESTSAANESEDAAAALASILSSLAQRQGHGPSMWEVPGPILLPRQECLTLGEVFESSKTAPDLYRTGVLALLSGGESPTSAAVGMGTIEDYLFGLLWKGLQSPEPVVELENVGKTILKFGASYFDDKESGGWSYCLPLIATQQFRTACHHLVLEGGALGRLQATHLGLLLETDSVGAELNNLGESEHQASGSLLTQLLVDYSNWLHGQPSFGALASLEYLQLIPNRTLMMDKVSFTSLVCLHFHRRFPFLTTVHVRQT